MYPIVSKLKLTRARFIVLYLAISSLVYKKTDQYSDEMSSLHAEALQKLRNSRNWLGEVLKNLSQPDPYPTSRDPNVKTVEPSTDVPTDAGSQTADMFEPEWDLVARIKFVRGTLADEIAGLKAIYKNQYQHQGTTSVNLLTNNGGCPSQFFDEGFIALGNSIQHLVEANHALDWMLPLVGELTPVAPETPVIPLPNTDAPIIQDAIPNGNTSVTGEQEAQSIKDGASIDPNVLPDTTLSPDLNATNGQSPASVSDPATSPAFPTDTTEDNPAIGPSNADGANLSPATQTDGTSSSGGSTITGQSTSGLIMDAPVTTSSQPSGEVTISSPTEPVTVPVIPAPEPQLEPATAFMDQISTMYPDLVNKVAEPLTEKQAAHIIQCYPDKEFRDAVLHELAVNHVEELDNSGQTSVLSPYTSFMTLAILIEERQERQEIESANNIPVSGPTSEGASTITE